MKGEITTKVTPFAEQKSEERGPRWVSISPPELLPDKRGKALFRL
jgi:hypothetical protein